MYGVSMYKDYNSKKATITATVTDKGTKRHNDLDRYMVYTGKETLVNEDSLWHSKYNSADVYGKIKKGCTYEFDVVGFRKPTHSIFRNILKAKKLHCNAEKSIDTEVEKNVNN